MAETTSQFPGVFRGQTRLASQQDLIALKEYVERLIAGPISELNENGYIPWKYTEDGTLDIEYLFPELINKISEKTGISITNNGIKFADNITALNFEGKYVALDIDENGALVCKIDEPSVIIPNFNEANRFSDALVKIENNVISGMIVPDVSNSAAPSVYGDWEAGTVVSGINWNKNAQYDSLRFVTNGPIWAANLNTYFEVVVTDGSGSTFASFVSAPISGNTKNGEKLSPASPQNSQYVYIYISDFKEENKGYSFNPRIELNLIKIVGAEGGRFNVKIIHHSGQSAYKYVSNDLLYNCGRVPVMTGYSIRIVNDSSSPSSDILKTSWCSGIKYMVNGTVIARLSNVYNLNKMAAVAEPIDYEFALADKKNAEVVSIDYSLALDKIASFDLKMKLNEETVNNSVASGIVRFRNAFGVSKDYAIEVPVLLNSQTHLKTSDELHEYFSDESYRVLSDFAIDPESASGDVYSSMTPWDSSMNLKDYDNGAGLMVVPGVGVQFPSGDWSAFVPAGSPDYNTPSFALNEKYFSRIFTGNSLVKFGGVFKIKGLTQEQFNDERLTLLVSCNQGMTWYDLKTIRNVNSTISKLDGSYMTVTGIMTDVEEIEDGLLVHWAYPKSVSSNKPLYFKLGMKPTSTFCIKEISLLNTDSEEGW